MQKTFIPLHFFIPFSPLFSIHPIPIPIPSPSHPIPLPLFCKRKTSRRPTYATLYFRCTYVTRPPMNKKNGRPPKQNTPPTPTTLSLFFKTLHTPPLDVLCTTCLTLPRNSPHASHPSPAKERLPRNDMSSLSFAFFPFFFFIYFWNANFIGRKGGGGGGGSGKRRDGDSDRLPCPETKICAAYSTAADGASLSLLFPPPSPPIPPPPSQNLASFAPAHIPHTTFHFLLQSRLTCPRFLRRHTYNCLLSWLPPCPHTLFLTPPTPPHTPPLPLSSPFIS